MEIFTVTEFGASSATVIPLLDDLADHDRRADPTLWKAFRIATAGHVDILEVRGAPAFQPGIEAARSAHYRFRRTFSACVPSWLSVAAGDTKISTRITPVATLLTAGDGSQPLVAVQYLKLSPLAKLLVRKAPADGPRAGILEQIVANLIQAAHPLWGKVERIERTCRDGRSFPASVAFMLGLDKVELIAVIRASNLEQIASLAEGLRRLTLLDAVGPDALDTERFSELGSAEEQARAGLFATTTTNVGLRLSRDDSGWSLDRRAAEDLIGCQVRQLTRARFPVGERRLQADATGEPQDFTFGLWSRWFVQPSDGRAEPLTMTDFANRLESYAGLGVAQAARPENTASNFSVTIGHPDVPEPGTLAVQRFQSLARRARGLRLHEPDSWLARWQRCALAAQLPHDLTNAGASLLEGILDALQDDPAEYMDLVDAAELLLSRQGAELRDVYRELAAITSARVRQDSAMHAPRTSVAFDGRIGHGLARRAFREYAAATAIALGAGAPLVSECATRSFIIRPGNQRGHVLLLGPTGIHHPIAWGVASGHELAHVASRPSFRHVKGATWEKLKNSGDVTNWEAVMVEVAADVLAFACIRRSNESPEKAADRFWFVLGPGVLQAAYPTGANNLFLSLRFLITGAVLDSATPEGVFPLARAQAAGWYANDAAEGPPGETTELRRAWRRWAALREDLPELWDLPRPDMAGFQKALELHGAYLPELWRMAHGSASVAPESIGFYVGYLDRLRTQAGIGDRPWPRLFRSDSPPAGTIGISLRGGVVFAPGDASLAAMYHDETISFMRLVEESGRRRQVDGLRSFLSYGSGQGASEA